MEKESSTPDAYPQILLLLRQAIPRYGSICAAAAMDVLGGLFGVSVDDALLVLGLGVCFEGPEGARQSACAGVGMFVVSRARLNGLPKGEIAVLCDEWRRYAGETPAAEGDGPQEAMDLAAGVLHDAFHFMAERQEQLGLEREPAKPRQYYDSIYTDRESMFQHSPYALEEKLSKAVARGEEAAALEALREIGAQGDKAVLAKAPLRSVKNSMIGSIAFLARAAIQAGVSANSAFALSDALTRRVEEMGAVDTVLAFEESILLQFIALVRQRLGQAYTAPVVKVMHYVDNHLDTKIRLDAAAAYAGVHPAYLSARFKKETGHTFTGYIALRKIQESCYFVRHTGYSISQIASLYGFSSQSYYITVFRRVMGATPMEYRRQLLAE